MSLTLVELAQAITDGKTLEKKKGGKWVEDDSGLESVFGHYELFPNSWRIKPKVKEYWLIPYRDKLGMMVATTPVSQWEPQMNVAGLHLDKIIHVKEVI